jgi:hypothetical protein
LGEPSTLETDVRFDSLRFDIGLLSSLRKVYRVNEAEIENLRVKVTDGDKDDDRKPGGESARPPYFHADRIRITKSHFEYHRVLNKVRSSLAVSAIHGVLKNVSTIDADGAIAADLECLFQDSGPHVLKLELRPFAEPQMINVDLRVHHQDMEGLSRFLVPNDGVELHGELVEGRGVTQMRGRSLHSDVWAEYRGLKVKVHKADDRSPVAAFFTTLATNLTTKKQNLDTEARDQLRGVDLKREAGESLVHFLLRGWKDAAIKVASAPGPGQKDQ